MAIIEPVGDHDIERILGTSEEGFAERDSEKSTVLMGFLGFVRALGSSLRFSGRERIGGAMVVGLAGPGESDSGEKASGGPSGD